MPKYPGIAAVLVLLVFGAVQSAGAATARAEAGAKSVKVTAGSPSEFSFTLSTKKVALGPVKFSVTNKGKLSHDFEVCSLPSKKAVNTCTGKTTKLMAPGKSALLLVVFKKKGTYAYLCTVPGHAAAGMKGTFTVS
jgi:uncharacterized cupredoxin-like copper-binding protein